MLKCYTPEMGEQEPTTVKTKENKHLTLIESTPIDISASLSHYGKHYYVRTPKQLIGRGVEKLEEGRYVLTIRAFGKLCEQYDVKMECLLD